MIPRDRSLGVLLALFVLACACLGARELVHLDTVPLALALEHQDLRLHQPQPPGFILHVWLAQLVFACTGRPVLALRCVSLLVLAVTTVFLYRLALLVSDRARARWSVFFFVTSPLVLFHGMTAGTAADEALVASVTVFLVLRARSRSQRELRLESYLVGLLAGLRPSTCLFAIPLLIWCARRLRLATRASLLAALAWLLGTLCWLVPQAQLAGGLDDFVRISWAVARAALNRTGWSADPVALIAMCLWGLGTLRLLGFAVALTGRRASSAPSAGVNLEPDLFLAWMTLPVLGIVLFGLTSTTYALALLPGLCLNMGLGMHGRLAHAGRKSLLLVAVLADLLAFVFVPTPATRGEGRETEAPSSAPEPLYAWWENLPASVRRAGSFVLARTDFFFDRTRHPEFEGFIATLQQSGFAADTVLLLGTRMTRAACFVLPEATIVQADPLRPLPFLLYQNRQVKDVQAGLQVPQTVSWLLLEGEPSTLVFPADPASAPRPQRLDENLVLYAVGDSPVDAWFVPEGAAPDTSPRLHVFRSAPPTDPAHLDRASR